MNINLHSKHIPALDGLRGLAILMIICLHYFPRIELFKVGWTGVDLFFVLSGYLITGRLLATIGNPDYFGKFYRNRILRIFPLYYTVTLIFFLFIYFIWKESHGNDFSFYFNHWKSFFLLTENWTFITYGLPDEGYLGHFWTLAIEEQFYIFWPLFVYFLSPAKYRIKIWTACIVGVIALRVMMYNYYPENTDWRIFHYNSFCRMDSFIMGAVLCQVHLDNFHIRNKWIKRLFVFAFLLIFIGMAVFKNMHYFEPVKRTLGYTFIALFFAWIVHLAVRKDSLMAAIFNHSYLKYCGKISYGLYVFHWPVILAVGGWMTNWPALKNNFNYLTIELLSSAVAIIISFGLSWFSYRYFESYFLSLKAK